MLRELDEEDYYLAVLLVGAYQETLGDMHNLLGDVNIVQVRIDESGAPAIIRRVEGDTVSELLGYNEYNTSEMVARIEDAATRACSSGKLDVDESQDCINAFRAGLNGYTYFEK
jgi:arginine decarboxylase